MSSSGGLPRCFYKRVEEVSNSYYLWLRATSDRSLPTKDRKSSPEVDGPMETPRTTQMPPPS